MPLMPELAGRIHLTPAEMSEGEVGVQVEGINGGGRASG